MTKNNKYLTFYLGAGASYNAVPIVSEFSERLEYFIKYLQSNHSQKMRERNQTLVKPLKVLKDEIEKHSTFDVYAKKLFLQKRIEELEKFKFLISVFLTFEQVRKKQERDADKKKQESIKRAHNNLDIRYDSLFALLINEIDGEINLDQNVRFISWNYDIQLELSMLNFYRNEESQNSLQDDFDKLPHNSIKKLNGDGNIIEIDNEEKNLYVESDNSFDNKFILQIIDWFNSKKYKSQIKFAWELDLNDLLYKSASDIIRYSEYLVSIGYSFPNFNRPIDINVLSKIDLKKCKVYIQDKYPKQVRQNIEWLDDSIKKQITEKFKLREQVNEFFVPPSFNISNSDKNTLNKNHNSSPPRITNTPIETENKGTTLFI